MNSFVMKIDTRCNVQYTRDIFCIYTQNVNTYNIIREKIFELYRLVGLRHYI